MNFITKLFFPAFVLFFILTSFVDASVWQNAVSQINQDMNQVQKEAKAAQKTIEDEKAKLRSQLTFLDKQVEQETQKFEDLKKQFEELLETEEKLNQEIETGEHETKALAEVLQTIAKDTDHIIENSLITPQKPLRHDKLSLLLDKNRFPSMEDIENISQLLFSEIKESQKIQNYTGEFIDAQGNKTKGEIIRIGKFTALYKKENHAGYLWLDKSSGNLAAVPGKSPWSVQRSIKNYFTGKADNVLIDITNGIILEQVNKNASIKQWLTTGGMLVWPILLVALAALIISLERVWTIGRIPGNTDKIMDRFRKKADKKDWDECKQLCSKYSHVPTCNVLISGLQYKSVNKEVIENSLEESILKELPGLERFMTTLSVLGAIAPLLGLLGTVTGMIHTFQGITIFGTSDPRMMSGGISEALLTTQLGLGVAIPIMIIHHFFDRKVEKIIADMEEKATSLITILTDN